MRRILGALFGISVLTGILNSCSEEINMIGGFQETAIVYGLLDQSDSIHFVKINRAFIGPGNSLEIAKIPDSSYFEQVEASITEYVNGNKTRIWNLKDTLIENKESGAFYAPEQKVYYFATKKCKQDGTQQMNSSNVSDPLNSLNRDAVYKLKISINGGEFEVNGSTELISGIGTSNNGITSNIAMKFSDGPGSYAQKSITANTGNSYVLASTIRVSFDEYIGTQVFAVKSFDWKLGETDVQPNSTQSFTTNGKSFYELIKENCSKNSAIDKRRLLSLELFVTAGSQDLYNYMTVNKPASTLSQSKPTFTNLEVSAEHRVIGIFSSRYTYSKKKFYVDPNSPGSGIRLIDLESTKELHQGPITGLLSFCSQHPLDNGTSWSCQ